MFKMNLFRILSMLVDIMSKIVYIGVFKKNGKELFRMQMIAGYQQMITGFRSGAFALERNTRYPSHSGYYFRLGLLQFLWIIFQTQ